MKTKSLNKSRINVITLGCSKNRVDSEVMMAQLKANDFDVAHEKEEGREVVIINTCGFIDNAKQESIDTILEYVEAKKKGKVEKLYVTGCLSERYKNDLEAEIPEVDAFFGTMELPALLKKFNADYKHELVGERFLTTPEHYAYMKISEGCNRTCAFCAIPLMRGKHISKPIEEVIKEAQNLVRGGVKEIMLIAQELTYYGLDLYKERKLPDLLHKLADITGLEWIRLHYAYPTKFPLEILDVIRERENICNYLDIPFQHSSDSVLRRMKRGITSAETKELIQTIRQKVPGIILRTTLLTGFPQETDEEFNDLLQFVGATKFERVGVFTYSHEEGTGAFDYEDDVPEDVKKQRANDIMNVQQAISTEMNQQKIGQVFKVLIDRKEGNSFVGRTEGDSPEVDNEVLIPASGLYLRQGDFVRVRITDTEAFDLFGEVVK